jgi:Flp pilus assembly protein TadG
MLDGARTKIAAGMRRLIPARHSASKTRVTARIARRFMRRQDGAAAVEFALVALPFLALTFAILETALVFFASQTLEAAAADSSRLIMTGQAQTGGFDKDAYKDAVCDRVYGLFDCKNGLYVNVQTYSDFSSGASAVNASPISSGTFDTTKMQYNPGVAGDIVVVTLYYQWPIYVSLLGNKLDNLNGGKRLLVATAVFRNEPYE